MSLTGAVAYLQTLALEITGIKDAPATPPESANVFPFVVAYPERGDFIGDSYGYETGRHTIITEIHYPRAILGTAVSAATAMIETYADKIIQHTTLNGTVETLMIGRDTTLPYEFGRLEWGGIETIGIRFHITVKIRKDWST